jgi:hypothetical protein
MDFTTTSGLVTLLTNILPSTTEMTTDSPDTPTPPPIGLYAGFGVGAVILMIILVVVVILTVAVVVIFVTKRRVKGYMY